MAGSGLWARVARLFGGRALAEARDQAARAEARLRDAIEAIPEGVVFLDAEGRYVLWNARYAEIYHRSADLFRPGTRLVDTLREGVRRGDYPDAIGREEAWLASRLAKLAAATGERHEQQVADGRWLMIEERRTSDGGVIGLRVDITEMKRQAALLEHALAHAEAAHRAKAEFLADMSHELRTPLNGVLGLAQALDAMELGPGQRALVSEIRTAARQLDRLVTGLLDYGDADLAGDEHAVQAAPDQPLRVLAADDNPTNRKVIALMLEATGAQVVTVENGYEAVEAWRVGAFDVVLMDLRMPVLDGLAAIRMIRAEEQAGGRPRTPMIVLSANTSAEDRAASSGAGADGHIAKPIRTEALFAALEASLAARAA
ncbi:MAG: response regulator [Phenylobacterium sp.]|uniref:response regulator n=1 Tax=Phenylobacterium sp. TaxID=1871053 RepID=UPI001A3884F0|nr:response regulator [Phenylobacterium sp.]MBL8769967.1 response regulator [Phenylobacterium sp.]